MPFGFQDKHFCFLEKPFGYRDWPWKWQVILKPKIIFSVHLTLQVFSFSHFAQLETKQTWKLRWCPVITLWNIEVVIDSIKSELGQNYSFSHFTTTFFSSPFKILFKNQIKAISMISKLSVFLYNLTHDAACNNTVYRTFSIT